MKSRLIPAVLAAVCLIDGMACAASTETMARPLVLVFSIPVGDKQQIPSDPEVVSAVVSLLGESADVDAMLFNPELPSITRAVMEGKIKSEALRKPSDPPRTAEIARGAGASYALRVQGTVVGQDIQVSLELYKVPSGGRWVADGGSRIAESLSGTAALNRKNAIMAAASTAVSQIAIMAFGGAATERLTRPTEFVPAPTPALPAEPGPRDVQSEHDRFVKQADGYSKKGDLTNAVRELRRAVNLMPASPQTRVKLAGVYWKLGMSREAIDECLRGLLFSKDDVSLYNTLAGYYITTGDLEAAAAQCREIIRLDPQNVDVRLNLGDLYWNQGKIDEATAAYEEAAKLAPQKPAPHEKLYKLYGARHMQATALEHLILAKQSSRGTDLTPAEKYSLLGQVVEDEFNSVLGKLKSANDDYSAQQISRDDFYGECKNVDALAEGLATFAAAQTAPDEFKEAHSYAILATSLLAQSTGNLLSYMETEKRQYGEQAMLLQSEAKTELSNYRGAVRKL